MGPEERARVVESLPNEVTDAEMAMPEGDLHYLAKVETRDALLGYFTRQKRDVYIGAELPIYYPGERRFAPDLMVVLDVESHTRGKWVVSHEGKGLDWVMEVHVGGDRKKDAEYNVERYARLGITEYFIFDRSREELLGYRLATAGARKYTRMKPRKGRFVSEVLGLELAVEDDKLRMWAGKTLLLESAELLELERQRADMEAGQRRELEGRLREEARRRQELERRVAELQALLEQRGG